LKSTRQKEKRNTSQYLRHFLNTPVPETLHKYPTVPETLHKYPTVPETLHKYPTVPETLHKYPTVPETLHKQKQNTTNP
jgi:hypothetical protein